MESFFIGQIMLWSGNWVPYGWLPCDGSILFVQQYAALYSIIGPYFNTKSGLPNTQFQIPNLQGIVPVGLGQGISTSQPATALTNYQFAKIVGAESVSLNTNNLPSHTHGSSTNAATAISASLAFSGNAGSNPAPSATTVPAAMQVTGGNGDLTNSYLYNNGGGTQNYSAITCNASLTMDSVTLAAAGTGTAHPNMMPYLSMYYIICVEGSLYPDFQQ